jgi:outer membrane protein W
MPSTLSRTVLINIILRCFVLAFFIWGTDVAFAGTPDRFGNNAEIFSVTITPNSVPAGTYPEIIGFVRNTSSMKNGKNGNAVFDVIAVIILPNGSQKRLLWNDVPFTADQRKSYKYSNNYDSNQVGTYTAEYFVYNRDRTRLYTSLSKSFTVYKPVVTSKSVQQSETTKKPSAYDRTVKTEISGERMFVGIGGYINTIDFSAGPTIILWPFKNLAIQGTYGIGTFITYEARTFYRFPMSQRLKPYLGAGYLHAERKTNVIGVDTTIKGDSFTVFGGVELPVYKNLYGYVDVSGTPMQLKKDVTNGAVQTTATVTYSPVTICTGVVLYLF